jgi:hypothetical protein
VAFYRPTYPVWPSLDSPNQIDCAFEVAWWTTNRLITL